MSFASLVSRTRLELGDQGDTFIATLTSDGSQVTYDMPVQVVSAAGLLVTAQTTPPTALVQGTHYTINEREGEITFTPVRPANQVVIVSGLAYKYFTDTEINTFVSTAFTEHVVGRKPATTYDTLPVVEEYLVAILGTIEALWVMATDAAFDIDIATPEGVAIPRSQRFAQIMGLIAQRMEQYKELAQALNVGPFRIQMFTLRRVSRTTNRLVPLYQPQEFDDRSYPPVRVFPPVDSGLTG